MSLLVLSWLVFASTLQAEPLARMPDCRTQLSVLSPSATSALEDPSFTSSQKVAELIRILFEDFHAFSIDVLRKLYKSPERLSPFRPRVHIQSRYSDLVEILEILLASEDLRWSEVQESIGKLLDKHSEGSQRKAQFKSKTLPKWSDLQVYESPNDEVYSLPALFPLSPERTLATVALHREGIPLLLEFGLSSRGFYAKEVEIERSPIPVPRLSDPEPGDKSVPECFSRTFRPRSFSLAQDLQAFQILSKEASEKLGTSKRYSPQNFTFVTTHPFIFESHGEIFAGSFLWDGYWIQLLHMLRGQNGDDKAKLVANVYHGTNFSPRRAMRKFQNEIISVASREPGNIHIERVKGSLASKSLSLETIRIIEKVQSPLAAPALIELSGHLLVVGQLTKHKGKKLKTEIQLHEIEKNEENAFQVSPRGSLVLSHDPYNDYAFTPAVWTERERAVGVMGSSTGQINFFEIGIKNGKVTRPKDFGSISTDTPIVSSPVLHPVGDVVVGAIGGRDRVYLFDLLNRSVLFTIPAEKRPIELRFFVLGRNLYLCVRNEEGFSVFQIYDSVPVENNSYHLKGFEAAGGSLP